MLLPVAVAALSSLANEHRLATFRLLVQAGPDGLPAGEIARAIGVPPSTLSTHLAALARAGLVTARRAGRSLVYSADFAAMRALLDYLEQDCCGGQPEICAPAAAAPPLVATS